MKTKICGACKIEYPETLEFFATKKLKTKIIFQWQCKTCQKQYRKAHYLKNREKYILKSKNLRQSSVEDFQKYKKNLKCEKCSENRWWVLDFHHIDPRIKDGEISVIVRKGSKKRLFEEIKKCQILCSNCHRDLHYQQKQADNA